MKIALFGTDNIKFKKVYTESVLSRLSRKYKLSERINKKNINANKEFLKDCEIGFATWGMPKFTKEEIKEYMPKMKAIFYSAGTVQYFAHPFLECGIKVFSAYAANAVPVTEYTFAQISLAAKGFFQASKFYRILPVYSLFHSNHSPGLYSCNVGLVGLGAIGQSVAEKLKDLDVKVYACDPFVSRERAEELNVTLVDMDTLFADCDVISNHLADKKELKNIYNYKLFRKMKKHSVFINTGRGAQVSEYSLALSLLLHPSRTFVADVLKHEIFPYINPLFWCPNAVITPHIAGSMGNEPQRMAHYMIDELERYLSGETLRYEITIEALDKMA